jgi:antitoxin component of MazEF toxin-antitoxin module
MVKRLRKVGNSNALLLDRALMELVGLEPNGRVQVSVSNGVILVAPAEPRPVDRGRLDACLNRVVSKRRSVLRKLAE